MVEPVTDWDELLSGTYRALVGSLTLYCGDPTIAEDCTQEALIRLWVRRRQVDDPRAWAFRCAFNLAASTFRRRAAERRAIRRSSERTRSLQPSDQIERALDLRRGLDALPARQRQAVLLRYLADFDIDRVALAMGCSAGTVKSHLARGLAALRAGGLLHDDENDDEKDDENIAELRAAKDTR